MTVSPPSQMPSMAPALWLLAALTLAYLRAAQRGRGPVRYWSRWRTASWLAGASVLAIGLTPPLLPFAPGDFRQHMLQHLCLGMLGPIGLVMAAPVTLFLKSVPPVWGRRAATLLRSRPLRLIAHPATALALNLGGMAALYFTPLYNTMHMEPVVAYLVHFHLVAAGALYAWVIAGPDPSPQSLSVQARLVVLGIAITLHSVMSQMLYAGIFVAPSVPEEHLRQAAALMYYGGDITELLLAFALVSAWRPETTGRASERRSAGWRHPPCTRGKRLGRGTARHT